MKTFFKFLSKNKLYTLIEAFGLAVSIGFIILLALYARTEYSIGAIQKNSDKIYAVGSGSFMGMTLETVPVFGASIPEITSYTRIEGEVEADFVIGDDFYHAKGASADTNFFDFFDYDFRGAAKNDILRSKNEVILSESFARILFPGEDPCGKTIKVVSGNLPDLTVIGVIEDFGPYDLFEKLDFISSIKNSTNEPLDQFGMVQTFITIADGASVDDINSKLLDQYVKYWTWYKADGSSGNMLWGSTLTRLDKVYFSPMEKYSPIRSGNSKQVNILLILGLVLLVSAVFNYVNLTVAQTGKRAKEMATRRLLGSSKNDIIWRYLGESFIFTLGCFIIGGMLSYIFLPFFNKILSTEIPFISDAVSIVVIVLSLLLISVISGIMPALIVSKYKAVDVVKGNFGFHSKMTVGRIFIVIQNIISVVFATVAFAIMLQVHHLTTLPLGYRTENLLQIRVWNSLSGQSNKKILRDKIKELPMVKGATLCGQIPLLCGFNGVHLSEDNMVFLGMPTLDTVAFRMFGFKVLDKFSDPDPDKIWLSRKAQGLFQASADKPKIGIDGRYTVCGVIEDYHVRDAIFDSELNYYNSVRMIDENYPYMGVLLVETIGDQDVALDAIRNKCSAVVKELTGVPKTLESGYIDDYLFDQLKGKRNTMLLVIVFMIVSILISALGLLAISVYYTGQQSRQTAVRKVYGSTVGEETRRLSRSFIIMSLIAIVVSLPASVWLIKMYLQEFSNRINFPITAVLGGIILSLLIAFISVWGSSLAAARRNPVDTLKKE